MIAIAFGLLFVAQSVAPPAQNPPPAPDCVRLLAEDPPARGIDALCDGEGAMRRASDATTTGVEREALWRTAAQLFRQAADRVQSTAHRMHALETLVRLHGAGHLGEPDGVEQALRELAAIDVSSAGPLVRLAKFQEQEKRFEGAEQTLYGARQQHPDDLELLREMSRFFARRVLAQAPPKASSKPDDGVAPPAPAPAGEDKYPECARVTFAAPGHGYADLCKAEEEMRLAARAVPSGDDKEAGVADAQRARKAHLGTAADYYRKAAAGLGGDKDRMHAYESLAFIYEARNLNDPAAAEPIVREMIALAPASAAPVIRLSSVQEALKQIAAAESTLIGARQQFPEELDVMRALSRFYARLATAAATALSRAEREREVPPAPGQPDANGYYLIGSHVPAPKKTSSVTAAFPDEARAVALQGVVMLELWLDETGRVTNARSVRSIPMLDEAAVAAALQWRFAPTVIDGRAVPVKLIVTHNFVLDR